VGLGFTTTGNITLSAVNPTGTITRSNNATALISSNNSLGVNTTGLVNKIQLADNGANMGLVGTTAANNLPQADSTQNLKISNFLFGNEGFGNNLNTFVTYDTALGTIRALETSEFATSLNLAGLVDQNVRVTASASGIGSKTINSLLCAQTSAAITLSGSISGTSVLTINSGVLYSASAQNTTISGFKSIVLKNGEGVIGTGNAGTATDSSVTTISSPITITDTTGNGNSGTLTKFGNGTLTLDATENYTGQTTINQGTLSIGNGTTDGDISSSPNIVVNAGATFQFNRVGNFTSNQVISGFGNFSKAGTGAQTLSGASTYTGTTSVGSNGGTLVVTGSISGSSGVTIGTSGGAAVLQVANSKGSGVFDLGELKGVGSL
jgi:autotransporter-associated beta strand protein